MTKRPLRIAIALNKSAPRWRRVLRGIFLHAQTHEWTLHTLPPHNEYYWNVIRAWKPQGMIGELAPLVDAGKTRGISRMRVDIFEEPSRLSAPHVGIDHAAVGEMAAQYLLDKGLRHIAHFVYTPVGHRGVEQRRGIERCLARHRLKLHEHDWTLFTKPGLGTFDEAIARWLTSLPRPAGVVLFDDDAALWVSQNAWAAGLRVPDDIALVGVNDDPVDCLLAHPPLASVALPLEQVGQIGAELLQRQFDGKRVRPQTILLPPTRVVERGSADVIATTDREVSAAIGFIRANRHRPLRVHDVLEELAISRRALERKFDTALGRSPLSEIRRAHLEQAKELLATTNLPLKSIAELSGFGRVEHFCTAMRRATGFTPARWRRQANRP